MWALDVKKVDVEALAKWEEKELFKEFVEEFNTGGLPHRCAPRGPRAAAAGGRRWRGARVQAWAGARLRGARGVRAGRGATLTVHGDAPSDSRHTLCMARRKYYDLAAYEMAKIKEEAELAAAKAAAKSGSRKAKELGDDKVGDGGWRGWSVGGHREGARQEEPASRGLVCGATPQGGARRGASCLVRGAFTCMRALACGSAPRGGNRRGGAPPGSRCSPHKTAAHAGVRPTHAPRRSCTGGAWSRRSASRRSASRTRWTRSGARAGAGGRAGGRSGGLRACLRPPSRLWVAGVRLMRQPHMRPPRSRGLRQARWIATDF